MASKSTTITSQTFRFKTNPYTQTQILYKQSYLLSFALLLFLAKVLLSKVVNNSFQQELSAALLKRDTHLYVEIYL